jgi:hypothetical protein
MKPYKIINYHDYADLKKKRDRVFLSVLLQAEGKRKVTKASVHRQKRRVIVQWVVREEIQCPD